MPSFCSLLEAIVPAKTDLPHYGLFGDYVGGVWGTLISFIALFVIFLTWRISWNSAKIQNVMSIMTEMLRTHDAIAESGEYNFWDRRGVPSRFLREFASVYKQTRRNVPSYDRWSVEDRIDIAYTIVYYGLNTQSLNALARHGTGDIKKIHDSISQLRGRFKEKYDGMFKGYQSTLSNYQRNLFGIYNLIDRSALSKNHKLDLAKIVRTKLSNYDQALLSLNIISHLGGEWESRGFVARYKPFANIPEKFFNFDENFSLKARFPTVQFEWEDALVLRPLYSTISIGHWNVIIERPRR